MSPFIHTEYVDNFVALSQSPGLVCSLAAKVGKKLSERGLPTHEVEAGVGLERLGWKFGDKLPIVQITPKRLWRLRLATQELLKEGRASGKLVEKLIGHFTFAALLRREVLSCFQAVYVFIRRCYDKEVVLWLEVKRELFWASSLLPLVFRDLSAEWATSVFATDASFWGRGVVVTDRAASDIQAIGEYSDRWRFSVEEEGSIIGHPVLANDKPLGESGKQAVAGMRGGEVPDVPLEMLEGPWRRVESAKWNRSEAIPILEGRALVWLFQHLARSQHAHGKRHLVLSDSLTATLSWAKGRSRAKTMNRVCRQLGAVTLATGMNISVRWMPSELNPADGPSRGKPLGPFDPRQIVRDLNAAADREKGPGRSWRDVAFGAHQARIGGEGGGLAWVPERGLDEGKAGEAEEEPAWRAGGQRRASHWSNRSSSPTCRPTTVL